MKRAITPRFKTPTLKAKMLDNLGRNSMQSTIGESTLGERPDKLLFYNLTIEELKTALKGLGKESFRAQQLFRWVYGQNVVDFSQMTNLSKDFREELPNILDFRLPKVVSDLTSVDGTRKFLFEVEAGKTVEAVLIPSVDRLTLCVSSEVGCNMGCKFCFTGKQRMIRKLETWEIVGQLKEANARLKEGQRITNIVFMGMGEPLDNPENVFKAIEIFHSNWGFNLSRKRITVSTSGIVPEMHRVIESGVRLAVSLNAVNDQTRTEIMPINKRWNLEELLSACLDYTRQTGDMVTFEYVLLKGVTDSLEDAKELAKIARRIPSKINIIPFNEHPGSGFVRPSEKQIQAFHKELMRLGIHVLRRKTMGRDIYAACGQLTSEFQNKPERFEIEEGSANARWDKDETLGAQL